MQIRPNSEAPINDTVRVHTFENDGWIPLAPFTTPQQWQLCHSFVNANVGSTKLNNILKHKLIVPDTKAKNLDQLYQHIPAMEGMDGLVCE
jgi:hypothetical protein